MNHRSLLSRATEGTDAPTPGYLYVDLAKVATGNPATCQDMASYLSNRLQSRNNPNIKFKCCKVIAKLCDQVPRNAFRRCIAQDHEAVAAIKEAMNFRGTMDPVLGDEPNQRVRIAAKEALDAVYREAPSSEGPAVGYAGAGGVSSSYGASPHTGSAGYGGGMPGGRRMEGIGNPMFSDARLDPRYNPDNPTGIKGVVKEAGEIISDMIRDPLARNIPDPVSVPRQGHSGNLPGYGGSSYGRPPPGSSELSRQTGGQWTMASNRGPGAVNQGQREPASQQWGNASNVSRTGTVGGSWGDSSATLQSHSTPSITVNSIPTVVNNSGGGAVSDGTYERNLVLELCPPGGMKPVPPSDKLANFERVCSTLNSDLICPVLLDCLEEGQPWVIRAKALCVMETSISAGTRLSDGANPYRDFFHACHDEVVPLASHPRAPIRDPAKRILQLLGIPVETVVATQTVTVPLHVEPPNLLDFSDEPQPIVSVPSNLPPAPAEAPPPPPAASPQAPVVNMFGGMQIKSGPTAANSKSDAESLLDFGTNPSTPAPTVARDIFGDVPLDQGKSLSNDGSNGFNNTSSIFEQMSIKDANDVVSNGHENCANVAMSGSAFGFINAAAGSSDDGNSSPTTRAKPIFDPLKSGTPNSASQTKKLMQFSPEQMQAMAYQQMMMQQQFQQMQMAVAMQNSFHQPGMVPMHPPLGSSAGMVPMSQSVSMNMRFHQAPNAASAGFSFIDAPKPAQKDDKKFDFVKDAMLSAGHKK